MVRSECFAAVASNYLENDRTRTGCVCSKYGMGYLNFIPSVYTLPLACSGVLCLHVGRPCVRTSICVSALSFRSIGVYTQISFELCTCVSINNIALVVVNGLFSIIYDRFGWPVVLFKVVIITEFGQRQKSA